jgi:metal-responsive CopG/Arc/MetJ family transcriptional regulator
MKVKTSVTLSEELLEAMSAETDAQNRSAFIETAIWDYLELRRKSVRDQREIDLINANADDLNAEARDASDYQDDE